MILRNQKNTNTNVVTNFTKGTTDQNNGINTRDCTLNKDIAMSIDICEKRLSRIESAVKHVCESLNVDSDVFSKVFIKKYYNKEGWIHEYSYGTRVYHCGYEGHIIEESAVRVVFQTVLDNKEIGMSVRKSDIGRDGNFTIFETLNV